MEKKQLLHIRHITEKGHTNTRRIHLHGLFYAREGQTKWQLTKLLYENWIDGYKYYGSYVNEKTINYVSKYMTKKDEDNPDYILTMQHPIILQKKSHSIKSEKMNLPDIQPSKEYISKHQYLEIAQTIKTYSIIR